MKHCDLDVEARKALCDKALDVVTRGDVEEAEGMVLMIGRDAEGGIGCTIATSLPDETLEKVLLGVLGEVTRRIAANVPPEQETLEDTGGWGPE